MFGVCVQTPALADNAGRKFFEAIPDKWAALPKTSIRHPNGTASFSVDSATDNGYLIIQDEVMPLLSSGVKQWYCMAPDSEGFETIWQNDRLEGIEYANEPPTKIPSVWANGEAYMTAFKAYYDGLAVDLQSKVFFHSGKPETLFYAPEGTSDTLIAKHQSAWDACIAAVVDGYPNRVATTHKLRSDYPLEKEAFYDDIIKRYRTAFGSDVLIRFAEYKLDDGVEDTTEAVLLLAQFLIVMSKMIYTYPDNIHSGSYQQGVGTGTINLLGRNESNEWAESWVTSMWTDFYEVMATGAYIETTQTDKPDDVHVAMFVMPNGDKKLLYSNMSDSDETLSIPKPRRFKCWAAGGGCTRTYDQKLLANTAGVITLR